MHELSIAAEIVSLAVTAVEEAGEELPVTVVSVRVGNLAGVVVEALEFAWDVAAEGTRCAGAELRIERVPGRVRCKACEAETQLSDPPQFACGQCGMPTADIVAGRELDLVSLELEETETASTELSHAAPNS